MPSPIELVLDPVSLIIFAIYASVMLWEYVAPAKILPKVRFWKTKGLMAFVAFFYLSSYLPLWWDIFLSEYTLFDISHYSLWINTLVALLVYEAGVYFWHKAMHKSRFLWLKFHQMHHSAERLDTYGAFWFSPMDMIGWTALGSFCLVLVLGIQPQAATLVILITTFFAVFQHANIKTPPWIGFIIQRPESHSLHHKTGTHFYNFSDLPILDIVFGTFRNPEQHVQNIGFYDGASNRVLEMITFQDVSKPKEHSVEIKAFDTP